MLVEEHGNKVSEYSWCHICSDPTQNDHWMSIFLVLCYLLKEYREESVGIWNPCLWFFSLVLLVIHFPTLGILIGTLFWQENDLMSQRLIPYMYQPKMADNKYLPIDSVRKDWEYPAQIFLNIYHGLWDG